MLVQILMVAAATAAATPAQKARETPKRVTTSCIGDRCAIYSNGRRVGSVTHDTGRYVVRDRNGRIKAKIRVER